MKRKRNNGIAGRAFPVLLAAGILALVLDCTGYGGSGSQMADAGMNSYGSNPYGGGEFGATQGGVQDMGLARELVANGRVPPPEAFTVEGMFSEHDLPLSGPACERLLCLRAAMGVAPDLDGEISGWLQVGLSSTIDPATYTRPSLTVVATVDVSGSMGWGYSTGDRQYPTPGAITRSLLLDIAGQLDARDRIAIVTYGSSVHTPLDFTSGAAHDTVDAAIEALGTAGSTNMEAGLQRAYYLARSAETVTDQVRVLLFTDVQPNVGATTGTEFERLAADGAGDGIGLTVFGVGLGLGQAVMNHMVHLRDGNAFSLFDFDDVDELMEDDWPWLVSPIAYDLSVAFNPAFAFQVADAYGFPGEQEDDTAEFDVATVFLSRRKGALLLRLVPKELQPISGLSAAGRLAYTTLTGESVNQDLQVLYPAGAPDERGMLFEQPSVGKVVALAVLVSGMKAAAEVYAGDRGEAVGIMQAVTDRIRLDATALDDPALQPEVELAEDLLDLMEQDAPQGDLYGLP